MPSAGRSTSSARTTRASSPYTGGCRTSCRSESTCTRRTTRAACPRARSPSAGARGCSTTNGAAATTRWTWCARSSGAGLTAAEPRADVSAHARAVRAHTRVVAGGRGVLRGTGHAHRERLRRHAHLRGVLPRPLRGRTPVHQGAAPERRSVHVPARRRPGRDRSGADLPDRRRTGARAGPVVRRGTRVLLHHDSRNRRPPRTRALPLHDRGGEHRAAPAAAPARYRGAGERSVPRHQDRPDPIPAGGGRKARNHRLPRELPARHGRHPRAAAAEAAALPAPDPALRDSDLAHAARDRHLRPGRGRLRAARGLHAVVRGGAARPAVAEALRPAAARVGAGDADADPDPGPRQLADVLRRLPRAALRGHRPPVADRGGVHDVLRRGLLPLAEHRARAGARGHLARPLQARRGRQGGVPARTIAVRPGRRRPVRPLPAARLPRPPDRPIGHRRLLEAAGHRPHGRAGDPGVRDRRRCDPRDPAHGRHASVRLLRRQLDRREHGAAGSAADRVRSCGLRGPAARRGRVNRQIVQLFGLFTLLFAVLVIFTSRWTVFEAHSLADNPANRRPLIEEQRIPRGLILASDNRTVLARSRGEGRGENRIYTRTYPTQGTFAHPVGYSFIENGRRGLELFRNEELTGDEDEFASILSGLESRDREGNDLVTNLDVAGTQAAVAGLAGRKGAVVALEPQTGKVRVMVSVPEYDPNLITSQFGRINTDPNKPLLNRTTQELYQPGSTFKVVTATAALDTGKVTPDTVIDGSSPRTISGAPLENSGGQDFGPISFTDALTNSVNTVFAQVGERVGAETLVEYMKRFGFYEDPQLDYPGFQMIPSGIRSNGVAYVQDGFDVGRVAIGQGGAEGALDTTPMQMALVAAAIANKGRLMKPRLVDRIVQKDGRVKERIEPDLQADVMKPETAEQLTAMMGRVVEEGTGTAAALAGIRVAGKTGTAEVGANREFTQPWFICFAPVENPRLAIAVTVERTTGQGGTVAAPIAKSVLEAMLGGGAG